MVVEVMGHRTGWLAVGAGIADALEEPGQKPDCSRLLRFPELREGSKAEGR